MNSLRVMAIGGGKIAEHVGELLKQSVEMVEAEKSPKVLLVPTARYSQEAHDKTVANYGGFFGNTLGLPTTMLHDYNQMPARAELEEKIEEADLIFVNGGDTARMTDIWRDHGIDDMLSRRILGGVVLGGISAGAIVPFTWGYSDSLSFRVAEDEPWDYIPVDGLNILRGAVTPHADLTPETHGRLRADMFEEVFAAESIPRQTPVGFCINNNAALRILDGKFSALSAQADSGVTMLSMHNGLVNAEHIPASDHILISGLIA